jgi:hypothetical protein
LVTEAIAFRRLICIALQSYFDCSVRQHSEVTRWVITSKFHWTPQTRLFSRTEWFQMAAKLSRCPVLGAPGHLGPPAVDLGQKILSLKIFRTVLFGPPLDGAFAGQIFLIHR